MLYTLYTLYIFCFYIFLLCIILFNFRSHSAWLQSERLLRLCIESQASGNLIKQHCVVSTEDSSLLRSVSQMNLHKFVFLAAFFWLLVTVCLYVCRTVLSVCQTICLSACPSDCWSVCPSPCLCVCLSDCLPFCTSLWLSVCLSSASLSVRPSVCLSVRPSVYEQVSLRVVQ